MNLADELRQTWFGLVDKLGTLQSKYPEEFFEVEDDFGEVYDGFSRLINKLGRIGHPPNIPDWQDDDWSVQLPGEGTTTKKDDKRGRDKFKVKSHAKPGFAAAPRQ